MPGVFVWERTVDEQFRGYFAEGGCGCVVKVGVCEEGEYYRCRGTGGWSKFAEGLDGEVPCCEAWVTQEVCQRRHGKFGFDVEAAQGGGGALAVEMVWVLEIVEQDWYGGAC